MGGSSGDCSAATGPELGPKWCRQEFGISRAEAVRRSAVMEQVREVGRGLVMEGFVSEEMGFEMNPLWDRKSVKLWRTGVMWSWERE